MLGIKMIYLKLNNAYSVEEFYDKIKNESFEAGVPALVEYGPALVIAFPEVDRNNQVQILRDRKGRFCVMRSTQPIGLDKIARNMVLEKMTGGLSGMSVIIGNKKKVCNEMVEKTAAHIEAMGL